MKINKLEENEAKAGNQFLIQNRWLKPTAIKKKNQKLILLAEANGNMKKKKTVIDFAMECIYCRRFQPTDQVN